MIVVFLSSFRCHLVLRWVAHLQIWLMDLHQMGLSIHLELFLVPLPLACNHRGSLGVWESLRALLLVLLMLSPNTHSCSTHNHHLNLLCSHQMLVTVTYTMYNNVLCTASEREERKWHSHTFVFKTYTMENVNCIVHHQMLVTVTYTMYNNVLCTASEREERKWHSHTFVFKTYTMENVNCIVHFSTQWCIS